MSYLQMVQQNRKRKAIADCYRVAKKQKESSTPHTYQLPQGAYLSRTQRAIPHIIQQTAKSQYPELHTPQISVHPPTNAQVAAYKDAVITKAWHDEWHKTPDDFGPARPMVLLTQPARINLSRHAFRAKDVHLNHWDCAHEPEGVKTQRQIQEEETAKKREKMGVIEAMKQEQRRRLVSEAAQNAQVIDLTDDDVDGDTKLWMYHQVDNTENYGTIWDDGAWGHVEGIEDYNYFLNGLTYMPVQNSNCYTASIPQNGYGSQQRPGVF